MLATNIRKEILNHSNSLKAQQVNQDIDEDDLKQVSRIDLKRSSTRKSDAQARLKAVGGFKENTTQRKSKCATFRNLTSDKV